MKINRAKKIKELKRQTLVEYIKSYNKVKNSKSQILSFHLIRQLEDELFYTKRKNQKLTHEVNTYFTKLNKIYHSRLWKLLGIYKKVEDPVVKLVKQVVPLTLRKKIKSQVVATIYPKQSYTVRIPDNIKKEWKKYKPQDTSIDLINFGIIAWNFRFQRPQQIASQFTQNNNRVFYIKNEFTPGIIVDGFAPFLVEKISKNIYEITLSASRNLFIYNDKPTETDINVIMASVKSLIRYANIINPIAKIDHPFWTNFLDQLSMPTIYDCMDNHQGFSETGKHLVELEQKLFQKADITLVTSHYLKKIANKYQANNITLIPNAGDYNHFSPAIKTIYPIPHDIKNIKGPIIGYYGAIAQWFDTKILETLAIDHPDKSIVLIGQVTNPKVEKLNQRYQNIYLLGEKKYDELPAYLSKFDVCTIPFIINELIKATHPVKVYEYLAAGKPIVATKMPEIFDLSNTIHLSTATDFSKNISLALKQAKNNQSQRQQVAKDNTWTARSKQLLDTIHTHFFPKISIIILSYNHPNLMKLTLNSVIHKSFYPNLEIIVVDNNSDSETISLLNEYKNNKNVKLIFNKTNTGFARGNNIGLKAATGDYLVLLNNDVIVTPGWLSRLLFHLKKDNVGLVGPVTNSIGNEAKIDHTINDYLSYTTRHWGETLKVNNIAAFCWIMSKTTYEKLGGLDEIFGRGLFEDDDYCKRILKSKKTIQIADDVFIHHFGGASFKHQSTEYQKLINTNKQIFEKKWHTKWIPHQYRK